MTSREKVINRINEILREVSDDNPGARDLRYIGSGLKKSRTAPRGNIRNRSIDNYNQMGGRLNSGAHILYDQRTGLPHLEITGGNPVAGRIPNKPKIRKVSVSVDREYDNVPSGYNYDSDSDEVEIVTSLPKRRKKRKDTGRPRNTEWTKFVKAVANANGLPYNKALSVASDLRKQGYTIDDF